MWLSSELSYILQSCFKDQFYPQSLGDWDSTPDQVRREGAGMAHAQGPGDLLEAQAG